MQSLGMLDNWRIILPSILCIHGFSLKKDVKFVLNWVTFSKINAGWNSHVQISLENFLSTIHTFAKSTVYVWCKNLKREGLWILSCLLSLSFPICIILSSLEVLLVEVKPGSGIMAEFLWKISKLFCKRGRSAVENTWTPHVRIT